MSISEELRAEILRRHHVDKWRVGTISRQLRVHHGTIKRVLSQTGVSKHSILVKGSMIDPYLSLITSTLERFPTLTASRLYDMVKERGYPGSRDHFRHLIAFYRPTKPSEAYLRLRTLPGEQAQVDWGHFGYLTIGKARRPLMAFVMVLSYSRHIFLRFYLHQRTENFLRGHAAAFDTWGGVPRVVLYDNLRSCVLERQGEAIRFNEKMLAFAGHYRYEPRPVAVCRGNEKGRVERAIRYIRANFFAGRDYTDLADLNRQASEWCQQQSLNRPCPEDKQKTVGVVFAEEKPRLLVLPDNPFPCDEIEAVSIGKTPYARFDWNDYSVPHTFTRQTLMVQASPEQVKIMHQGNVVAEHHRSHDKDQQIECAAHITELATQKRQASQHRNQHRLTHAVACADLFLKAAALRNTPLRTVIKQLVTLLDLHGAQSLQKAMQEALNKGVPHPNAVRQSLERRLEETQQLPPLNIMHTDERVNNLTVKPHSLTNYAWLEEK